MAERRVKCGECGRSRPEERMSSASHHGGGSYRRAGRQYRSSICDECVLDLAPRAFNNVWSWNLGSRHWSGHSIEQAARRLGWQGPPNAKSWQREKS